MNVNETLHAFLHDKKQLDYVNEVLSVFHKSNFLITSIDYDVYTYKNKDTKKVFKCKFSTLIKKFSNLHSDIIKELTNTFLLYVNIKEDSFRFEFLSGDRILECLDKKNYSNITYRLRHCATHNLQNYVMLSDHPDIFKSIVMYNKNNKICGFIFIYMDKWFSSKVYSESELHELILRKHLKTLKLKKIGQKCLTVKLKKNYIKYPYMDDFRYFNPDTLELRTNFNDYLLLRSVNGEPFFNDVNF